MNPRVMLVLFLGVGLVGGLLFLRLLVKTPTVVTAPAVALERVFVTTRPLQAGDFIHDKGDLREEQRPASQVPLGAVHSLAASGGQPGYVGAVLRQPVAAGAVLLSGQLVPVDASDFLVFALSPDKRAVSIKLASGDNVDGFVEPGDKVDVVMRRQANGTIVARGVAQNVRVLAVDRRLVPGKGAAAAGAGKPEASAASQQRDKPMFVTLEVTPQQVADITLATDMGVLSLALRSIRGEDQTPIPHVQVEQPQSPKPDSKPNGATVHVYNGAADTINVQF